MLTESVIGTREIKIPVDMPSGRGNGGVRSGACRCVQGTNHMTPEFAAFISGIEKLDAEDQAVLRRFNALIVRDTVLVTLDVDGRPFHRIRAINVGTGNKIILWLDPKSVWTITEA